MRLSLVMLFSLLVSLPGTVAADAIALQGSGDNAYAQGNYSQAATFYRRALRETPNNAVLMLRIAQCEEVQGRTDAAIKMANQARGVDPQLVEAYVLLGRLHGQKSQWIDARIAYQTAIIIQPSHPVARVGLGQAIRQLGDDERANVEMRRFHQQMQTQDRSVKK